MTQQQAEALSARLTRIWTPTRFTATLTGEGARFELTGYWPNRTRLTIGVPVSAGLLFCFLQFWEKGRYRSSLAARTNSQSITSQSDSPHHCSLEHELPQFRRNSWLSGCPLEATAHEKLEWVRNFTREEIEAWNLKI